MSLTIEPYAAEHLEAMLARYNAETAHEPHIAPLDAGLFEQLVVAKASFDPAGLLVARDGAEVVAWVHACVTPGTEGWHDQGRRVAQIRMLIAPAARMDAGRALVAAATEWLARSGAEAMLGIHAEAGYPFYRGLWMGGEPMGPGHMPHVQLALEVGGYRNTQESIFMVAELGEPPAPRAVPGVELVEAPAELPHAAARDSWVGFAPVRTRALLGGAEVGSIGWVIQPHLARLGAPCMNIWGLGVREEQRRKGIAALLVAAALRSAYAQGARHASVGTQLWNVPAHATYARFGFRPHALLIGRTRTA